MPDIEEIIRARGAKRRTEEVVVCLDPEVTDTIHEARAMVTLARDTERGSPDTALTSAVPEAAAELTKVVEAAEKAGLLATFTIGGLGTRDFQRLRREHPPTEEQLADPVYQQLAERRKRMMIQWNTDTFPAELLAVCSIDPIMDVDQANRLCDVLDSREWEALFQSCLAVCEGSSPVGSLGKG